jgi:hypothetical protein
MMGRNANPAKYFPEKDVWIYNKLTTESAIDFP